MEKDSTYALYSPKLRSYSQGICHITAVYPIYHIPLILSVQPAKTWFILRKLSYVNLDTVDCI